MQLRGTAPASCMRTGNERSREGLRGILYLKDIGIDLRSPRRDVSKWCVLKPKIPVSAKHENGLTVDTLKGLHIAVDLHSGWRNIPKGRLL